MDHDKIYEDSTTKNDPNKPQLIRPICQSVQISQNIQDITEKNPYWASVVRASEAVRFLDLLIWS